jgi:hypothetical protein
MNSLSRLMGWSMVFLLSAACHSSDRPIAAEPAARTTIHLVIDTTTTLPVSELIDTIIPLPLQLPTGHTIGAVERIAVAKDNTLYLVDRINNRIDVIDSAGRFRRCIDHGGLGKGKWRMISDLRIDPADQTIGLVDPLQAKFMRLDGQGNLLNEYPLSGTAGIANLAILGGRQLVFARGIPPAAKKLQYRLLVTGPDGSVSKRLLPYDRASSAVASAFYPFQQAGDQTYYLPIYQDRIYRIDSAGVYPDWRLDFGSHWMTAEYAYSEEHSNDYHWIMKDLPRSEFVYFVNYVLTTRQMLIYYSFKGNNYLCVYDRMSGKQRTTRLGAGYSALGLEAASCNTYNDAFVVSTTADNRIFGNFSASFKDSFGFKKFTTLPRLASEPTPSALLIRFKTIP